MKRRTRLQTFFIFVLLMMAACVEPYQPPSSSGKADYLVVDGFLNGTDGSATVKLSRAIPLSISIPNPPEKEASVIIESDGGESFTLPEVKEGLYVADNLDVNPAANYRVHIVAKDGTSYLSDYITMRIAPAIDSVTWLPETSGTQFYVSSHDPSNTTTYYRYLFTETWEYRVTYFSDWKSEGGTPVFRNPTTEQVYTCWNSTVSTEILTTSTKRLNADVVSMMPINFLKKGSRRLSRIYSINVQQRAITQVEYEYWELIRKTTESLGGLFDPLPSQVISNIHNEDGSDEMVLGYFSGGFVAEKRIFLYANELPPHLQTVEPYDFECKTRDIPIDETQLIGADVFVAQYGQPPAGYSASTPNCADCTSLGGTTKKPTFWPQ